MPFCVLRCESGVLVRLCRRLFSILPQNVSLVYHEIVFFSRGIACPAFKCSLPFSPTCAVISPDTGERCHKSFSWGRDPLRLRTGGGRRRSGRSTRARGSVPEPAAPPDDTPRISSRSRPSLNRTRKQQSTVPKATLFVLSGRLFVIFDFALQRYHIEFWQDL